MHDVLIVGGGVIGLSLAWQLAERGARVRLVDRAEPGREASWAGAGILPPAVRRSGDHPLEQLAGLSHTLHPHWAQRFLSEVGIDNGYRRCGGLYVAVDRGKAEQLEHAAAWWHDRQIVAEIVEGPHLNELEPAMAADRLLSAWHLPDEAQIRNPRHLQALLAMCLRQGVEISHGLEVEDFRLRGERIEAVRTRGESLTAEKICITSGAWSGRLLETLGTPLPIRPVRGQMVLLDAPPGTLRQIVNEGSRYLVPRPDGRLLVGSTEEHAGFDKRTTSEGVSGLLQLALRLVPALGHAAIERCWAGLRPGTQDLLPYLAQVPGLQNAFVATGHFRQGLHLSTATAVVMAQLISGQTPEIDLSTFRLDRG